MKGKEFLSIELIDLENGWFDFILRKGETDILVSASDYLGVDSMRELLISLISLAKGNSSIQWVRWFDEPGSRLWKLKKTNDKIQVYDLDIDLFSYKLIEVDENELLDMNLNVLKIIEVETNVLLEKLVFFLEDIKSSKGQDFYEENWFEYPRHEISKIKDIVKERSV